MAETRQHFTIHERLPNLWLQCFISSLVFAAIDGSQGSLAPIPTAGFTLSVLWTGLSTLGGYGLYWMCLRRSTATRVTSVLYLSPPITLLWAWAMFDEPLSWQMAIGMAISAIGVWIVMRAEARQTARASCAAASTAPSSRADVEALIEGNVPFDIARRR